MNLKLSGICFENFSILYSVLLHHKCCEIVPSKHTRPKLHIPKFHSWKGVIEYLTEKVFKNLFMLLSKLL